MHFIGRKEFYPPRDSNLFTNVKLTTWQLIVVTLTSVPMLESLSSDNVATLGITTNYRRQRIADTL